jgi:hypothetical protein
VRIWDSAPIRQVLLDGGDTMGGYRFDRIQFQVDVPEPAPLALLASALLILPLSRSRRSAFAAPSAASL